MTNELNKRSSILLEMVYVVNSILFNSSFYAPCSLHPLEKTILQEMSYLKENKPELLG